MSTTILITGANSGVGYGTASVLSHASKENHIIMAGRNSAKLEAAVQKLAATNPAGKISSIILDVNDSKSIHTAAEQVTKEHGRLDVLINNAGIYSRSADVAEQFTETFRTNVTGPVLVTRAFTPLLLQSQNAYLLHITSTLGSLTESSPGGKMAGVFDGPAYCASKAALNMIAVNDAYRLGPRGVKVLSVSPGLVESNLRGEEQEEITAGGAALSAETSGDFIKRIIAGEWDAHVGRMISEEGVYAW